MKKYLSAFIAGPAGFLVILFFFLPWVTISCTGGFDIEASGYDLASGNARDELEEMSTDIANTATGFTEGLPEGSVTVGEEDTTTTTTEDTALDSDPKLWLILLAGFMTLGAVALRLFSASSIILVGLVLVIVGGVGLGVQLIKYFDLQDLKHEIEESQTSPELSMGFSVRFEYNVAWWLTLLSLATIVIAGLVALVIESAPPVPVPRPALSTEDELPKWMNG